MFGWKQTFLNNYSKMLLINLSIYEMAAAKKQTPPPKKKKKKKLRFKRISFNELWNI